MASPPPDDPITSTEQELYRGVASQIEHLVVKGWLYGAGRAKAAVSPGPRSGATGTIILQANVSLDRVVAFFQGAGDEGLTWDSTLS